MVMEHKDLSILSRPSLSPLEAWQLADPIRRRAWFPDGPPELESKAAPYELPPAQPAGLPPELEAAVQNHMHDQAGSRPGPCPHAKYTAELWNQKCVRCKGSPAEREEARRWQRHADAVAEAQQLDLVQRGASFVPVYDVGEQLQRDSRLGKPPVVDRISYIP